MNTREKILALIVAATLGLWGLGTLWANYVDTLSARRRAVSTARDRLNDTKLQLLSGQQAVAQLDRWQQRSLPPQREVAASLYRTWLQEQFKAAGIEVDNVQSIQRAGVPEAYAAVGYTVTAQGPVRGVASWLYRFYRSPMLQKITRLQLRPVAGGSRLEITLTAEALMLPGAVAEDRLPAGDADRLAKQDVDQYVESIEGRNLFAVYRPPRPDPPPRPVARRQQPPKPQFDDAEHAYFTGTVGNGDAFQAWINVRTTNESLRLMEGDPIKVGLLDGKIMAVEPRWLILQADDQQWQVDLGQSLRDGRPVDIEDKATTTTEAEQGQT